MRNEISSIQTDNLSIVIQGSILDSVTNNKIDVDFISNLNSIIEHFPESQIIVSTWLVSENIKDYLLDKYPIITFIFNDDVGPIKKEIDGVEVVSNVNRMLISTSSGLREATRDYSVKIRTDSFFNSNILLALLKKIYISDDFIENEKLIRDNNFKIFSSHVVNCNLFARNPNSHLPFLFHPGDIMLAGKTVDLQLLFNIPLANNDLIGVCKSWMNSCYMKLVPEQYLWVKCIEQVTGIKEIDSNFSTEKSIIARSEQFYLNNFIPFSSEELGFEWRKHQQAYHRKGLSSVYLNNDWVNLYRKYITHKPREIKSYMVTRCIKILFMKFYFFFRTRLLSITLVRKIASKFFVKRKG